MSRVRQELSIVQFQVENRQASASMDALRERAKKLNEDITAANASIKALGNVAPDDAGLKAFQKKLKELNSDLRDVTRAQNELMKGVKAADKLWKAAATGTMESLSVKEIKAGQRGMQARMQNLQPTKENARELQAMKIAIEEGEIAMRKFEADAERLLKVISEGGAVSSSALSKTKNDLAGLLDVLPRGTEEYKRYDAQLQAIEKHISTLSQTEKRLAGEIVTVEDARKRAAAADAEAAQKRAENAQKGLTTAKEEAATAQASLETSKQKIVATEQEIAKTKEQLAAQQQLVGSIEALEDAESKAFSKMLAADTALQKQREETHKFSDATWDAAKKVGELEAKLKELEAQGGTPKGNATLEQLKKDIAEAELQLIRLKRNLSSNFRQEELADDFAGLTSNQGTVSGKAKLAKTKADAFTSTVDSNRPIMGGIYHDESGYGVATDGMVLLYDKALYDKSKKGKVVATHANKEEKIAVGDEIAGNYPKWRSVSIDRSLPNSGKADLDALSDFLAGVNEREREAWKQAKEAGAKGTLKDWLEGSSVVMKLPDGQYVIMGTATLTKTVTAAKEMGADTMSWGDRDGEPLHFTGKRGGVIAMPQRNRVEDRQDWAYDMSGGATSGVSSEETKAKIAQLEQEIAAKKKLIEVAGQEKQSIQSSVDVDKQKAELQQQLADAQQKLNETKTAAEGPTKKLQEAEAAYAEAQKKEQEATEALAKAKGNMNLGEEEDKLDALERKHDDLTESLQKQKQAEQELAQNAADTRQKEQEAVIELAQAQNQSEESLKKSVEVLEQQNKTLKAGSDEWIENEQAIGKLNKRIEELKQQSQELRGEMMSLAEAEELADKAMEEQALTTKTGWAASTEELKRAEQTLAEKVAKAKRGTAEEEAAYQKLVRQLQAVRTELGAGSMSGKQMMDVLSDPKNVTSVDTLKAAIGRARQELDALGRRLDQAKQSGQSGEVKKLQKTYDELAKSVQETDIRMKELQNSSKGTASAFDKAWSRLKTYVGLYVGAAVAMQKLSQAMGDLLTLSDKMGEVRKTTGFTADEVGRLSNNLAKLDTRTSLTSLMELSSLAGSVGLKTQEQVQGFTEAADQLIVALPELGNESARTIIKIANATGDLEKNGGNVRETLEKVGSTIIALRANSASAAGPITDFVSRVGAVGAQAGISIDQIAALGSTIDALGGRVEMSATALSRMIPAIKNNSFAIANSIGVTEEYLKSLAPMEQMVLIFQKMRDNIQHIDTSTEEGMNAMADNVEAMLGKNATMREVMKDLEQQGARAGIVFGLLSQNVDELEKQLGIASEAYRENTALANEFANMNETAAAKWARLKNQVEEMFVGDQAQRFLGGIIDGLRKIIDLLTGNGGVSIGLRTILLYMAALRLKLADVVAGGLKALWTGIKNIGVALGFVRGELKKMQMANIFTALAAAALYAYHAFKQWHKEATVAEKAVEELNQRIEDEKRNIDNLIESYFAANKESNERKMIIDKLNQNYSSYLGYMITEVENTDLVAAAHRRLIAVLSQEMLEREKLNTVSGVRDEYREKLNKDAATFRGEMKEMGLSSEAIGDIRREWSAFKGRLSWDADKETLTLPEGMKEELSEWVSKQNKYGSKIDFDYADPASLMAIYMSKYITEKYGYKLSKPLEKGLTREQIADLTGIQFVTEDGYRPTEYAIEDIGYAYKDTGRNLAKQLASTTLDELKAEAEATSLIEGDIAAVKEDSKKSAKEITEELMQSAEASYTRIQLGLLLPGETIEKAYQNIAQDIEALNKEGDKLKGNTDEEATALRNNILQFGETIEGWNIDKKKLDEALEDYRRKVNGPTNIYSGGGGGGGGNNPYGTYNPVLSPYEDWNADALVSRRKEMLERVRALANGADVQAVLSEDAKFITEATRNNIKTTKDAIEWYNTERLKIQDALHEKHLTNTGDWMDPKKGGKKASKLVQDEMKYYLEELDAYYTERKTRIQEAATEEGITEAEMKNRTLANEMEWHQRRAELQKLYAKKSAEVTEDEQKAIFDILSDRTGETAGYIEKDIASTVKFIEKVGKEKGRPAMDRILGALDLGIERDYLKQQQAVTTQMKAIRDIIEKERPYDGITRNLRENLVTMGILTADMTAERNRLMRENADMSDFNSRQAAEEVKRTAFMLGEAENAYSSTIEEVMRHMGEQGMQAWADAIRGDTQMQQALMAQLRTAYDAIQDAIKKEASLIKKQTDIWWADIAPGQTQSRKGGFEAMLSSLGLAEDQVKRANSLIGAGQASQRVADKLAIKQMQVRLAMQMTYYQRMRQIGEERIAQLKAEDRLEDAEHLRRSLNLSLTKEQTELDKQRVAIANQLEESQNRLYTELKSWADLLTSSLQSVFEASHAGDAEYYNELAKLNLTGKGGPGAGTYIVIDNAGTSDATAHYEYLDEREALERQHEIERENAQAEAWKKVMDDINTKMSETITDQLNAMLQNASIDANTDAENANTKAILANTEAIINGRNSDAAKMIDTSLGSSMTPDFSGTPSDQGSEGKTPSVEFGGLYGEGSPGYMPDEYQPQMWDWNAGETLEAGGWRDEYLQRGEAHAELTEQLLEQQRRVVDSQKEGDKEMTTSTQSMFAKMTQAANLYGIAYQAMSNDNLSAEQQFGMIAVQAAGNAAMAALTANFAENTGEVEGSLPAILAKCLKINPIWGTVLFAALSATLGGLMGIAVSKIAKSKSEIAQATGANNSVASGRLSTGMLTYAEGNVNEFTDPSTLTPGKQYNVDAADGRTYRARYMGRNPKTHLTNGPEFHLSGERGREMIIDAGTTRQITMNESEIWHAIQTLSGGGSARRFARRGRGIHAFADGNIEDFMDGSVSGDSVAGMSGMSAEQAASLQASIDRQSDLLEDLRINGIKATFDVYGKGGLVDSYDTGKKTLNRYGQRY